MEKKTTGAWLIHHNAKLQQIATPTTFDSITLAGKAGLLLSALSESNQDTVLQRNTVEALARASGIMVGLELPTLLTKLEESQLINRSSAGDVQILGLTMASVLTHTADIFHSTNPQPAEVAVIDLAELTSIFPSHSKITAEYLSDTYSLTSEITQDVLQQSEEIGFIDVEDIGDKSKLYFNGNLFRRDNAKKTAAILSSLNPSELQAIQDVEALFAKSVTVSYHDANRILGAELLGKLHSIGLFDVNTVSNERESVDFLTKPAAFSKYGNALVEDALDLVKAFVTSLSYGINNSPSNRGRIAFLPLLMRKLLRGEWVGPATAIGHDYKVLEMKRVIQVKREIRGMFYMRLLKKDVGELALQAISQGDISEASLPMLNGASITNYAGPESNRELVRKRQNSQSKRTVVDLLRTLRV
jgi:hypothetical protein